MGRRSNLDMGGCASEPEDPDTQWTFQMESKDWESLLKRLHDGNLKPSSPDLVDEYGFTALHNACGSHDESRQFDRYDLIRTIVIEFDANPNNSANKSKNTPLHLGAMKDNVDNVYHLMSAGFDPRCKKTLNTSQ